MDLAINALQFLEHHLSMMETWNVSTLFIEDKLRVWIRVQAVAPPQLQVWPEGTQCLHPALPLGHSLSSIAAGASPSWPLFQPYIARHLQLVLSCSRHGMPATLPGAVLLLHVPPPTVT